ncbi:hypothetical protein BJ508DRAFT_82366 [Ascobolus immersus RN42]|uniref:PiggyBac transposable element-derived protein domain-containing protein n=1 Tax=Ascobolus immersus RN42 TaxID=1160509 RepID=A0A3N4HC45_ASCIM|nr:hypothetical protein BJ508DRAFT_82366 [Ascobolus immersus RN42]
MNGVDRCDHNRSTVTTHKKGWRVWLPIWWWMLDTMGTNAYYLYCLHAEELAAMEDPYAPAPEDDEDRRAFVHKAWLQHVAIGLMQNGSRKMKGHVRETDIFTDSQTPMDRVCNNAPRSYKQRVRLTERIHSKVTLSKKRFERPEALHQPVRITDGRRLACRHCQFVYSGTRKPSARHPLGENRDAIWDETIPRYNVINQRTPTTRFQCGHCQTPLCIKRADGKDCWEAFHDYFRD